MQLTCGSRSVGLVPVRYEFATMQSADTEDWDSNWLMIQGHVADGDLTWSFVHPYMTTWEARQLSVWLRLISSGTAPDADLMFTEPNVQLRFLGSHDDEARISVGFAAESAPPGTDDERRFGDGHPVELTLPSDAFGAAADEVTAEPALSAHLACARDRRGAVEPALQTVIVRIGLSRAAIGDPYLTSSRGRASSRFCRPERARSGRCRRTGRARTAR
jgi:hypothetical protein